MRKILVPLFLVFGACAAQPSDHQAHQRRTEVLRETFDDVMVESQRSTDGKRFETKVLSLDGTKTLATQTWDLATGAVALTPADEHPARRTATIAERASLTTANRRARALFGSPPPTSTADDNCVCVSTTTECIPESTCQTPCTSTQVCYGGGFVCDFPAPDCDPTYGDCGDMYCYQSTPVCDPPTYNCDPEVCETVYDCEPVCVNWSCDQST